MHFSIASGYPDAIDAAAAVADPCHAFLRAAWFAASQSGAPQTLIVRRRGGGILAAVPTRRAAPYRLPVRSIAGGYWPYRSFPVAADAGDEELVAMLGAPALRAATGPIWRLGPVYENDPTASRLLKLARAAGWSVLRRDLGVDFVVDLSALMAGGGWPRGSTLKKNRYFERQLGETGPLECRFHRGAALTPALFDTLAQIEARSWVASRTDRSGAKFIDPATRGGWERAARDPAIAAMMSAAVLSVGDAPVAFSFDLDVGARKHVIANGYDQACAQHSPGRVLAYRNLADAAARGIEQVDWGSGDGGYKTTLGAAPGARIVDLLFVRSRVLAAMIRPLWMRGTKRAAASLTAT